MKQTENEMNVSVPLEVIKASEIEYYGYFYTTCPD